MLTDDLPPVLGLDQHEGLTPTGLHVLTVPLERSMRIVSNHVGLGDERSGPRFLDQSVR